MYNQKEVDINNDASLKRFAPEKKQKNNYLLNRLPKSDKLKTKRVVKTNGNLKTELKEKFTFLYIYGINTQDVKSLIKTLGIPVIITKEIQYADAILALANLVKNNRKLKQISHSKKITIHTIQSNNLLQIAKALRLLAKRKELIPIKPTTNNKKIADLISQEFLTPLEETRLAIEEVVIAKNIPIDLIPRTSRIRKQQHELVTHYQLKGVSVGKEQNRRIRILPN